MFDDAVRYCGRPPEPGDAFFELWSRRIGPHAPAELRRAVVALAWSLHCATGYSEADTEAIVHASTVLTEVCAMHRETLATAHFLAQHAGKKGAVRNVETVPTQGALL